MRQARYSTRRTGPRAVGAVLVSTALLLAACGGGSQDAPAAPAVPTPPAAAPQAEAPRPNFYEGASIEILVPFSVGGGTDATARYVAPFLNEALGANSTIQVVNEGGGGSVPGVNSYALQREKNGFNLLMTGGSSHLPYILGDSRVQYDLNDFLPIVGFGSTAVMYVRADTGVTTAADLRNPSRPFTYAGQRPVSGELPRLILMSLLGMDIDAVFGYGGRGEARLAFEQGEANIDLQTSGAYLGNVVPLVESGLAVPILSTGTFEGSRMVRDPFFPDLPHPEEAYELVWGEKPSGPGWQAFLTILDAAETVQKILWIHKDAPVEAYEDLIAAVERMAADPGFVENSDDALGGYPPILGQDLRDALGNLTGRDQAAVDWTIDFLEREYEYEVE